MIFALDSRSTGNSKSSYLEIRPARKGFGLAEHGCFLSFPDNYEAKGMDFTFENIGLKILDFWVNGW